jgi:hypothetical protein
MDIAGRFLGREFLYVEIAIKLGGCRLLHSVGKFGRKDSILSGLFRVFADRDPPWEYRASGGMLVTIQVLPRHSRAGPIY